MSKIEVYWGDKSDGERRCADFDDERYAQAYATWLQYTDGIIEGSVRVKLPEQRRGGPVEQHDNPAVLLVDERMAREELELLGGFHSKDVDIASLDGTQYPDPTSAEDLAAVRQLAASGQARAIREASQLSVREIGAAVGVVGSCISRWESAQRSPRGDAARRYLALLRNLERARYGGEAA